MAEENRRVSLVFEFSYKLCVLAIYFDANKDQQINEKRIPQIIYHVINELEVLNEYSKFLVDSPLKPFENLVNQNEITEYLNSTKRMISTIIHLRYGDPYEAAVDLGEFFAMTELVAPSDDEMHQALIDKVKGILSRLGVKVDQLSETFKSLIAKNDEERRKGRKDIATLVEAKFGATGSKSWLIGIEFSAGIPGIVQLKKTWK